MLQGKADIIRPFLYKRQQNNDSKYQSNTAQDKTGANAAPQIPFPVFRQLDNTDPVVADIIALQIVDVYKRQGYGYGSTRNEILICLS